MNTKQNYPNGERISRGFTLIELLTVIAIIGILASILIPVVGSVRESAKVAACTSQLRDLGLAVHLYAEDHNDNLPPNLHDGAPANVSGSLGGRVISLLLHPDKGGLADHGDYLDDAHPLFCPHSTDELFADGEYKRPEDVNANNPIGRTGWFWMYFRKGDPRDNSSTRIENPNRPLMWDFPLPGTAGLGPKFTHNPHEKRLSVWHIGGHVTSADLDEVQERAATQNDMYDFFTFGKWD